MLRIYGLGGVAVPARSATEEVDIDEVAELEVPGAGVPDLVEAGVQDLVVDVRDSDNEKLSTDADDEDGQQAAARVAAARVAKAARLSQIQNDISDPNLSLAQLALITKKELETDKAEEETRRRGELMATPVDEVDNDLKGGEASNGTGSMIDQISSQLRAISSRRCACVRRHVVATLRWGDV
jgi:hypothetical protein